MTTAAARMRKSRERERDGRCCVTIELGSDDIELLIEARVLDARRDFYDRETLAHAVIEFLRLARCA
jgi:hypothetical protein